MLVVWWELGYSALLQSWVPFSLEAVSVNLNVNVKANHEGRKLCSDRYASCLAMKYFRLPAGKISAARSRMLFTSTSIKDFRSKFKPLLIVDWLLSSFVANSSRWWWYDPSAAIFSTDCSLSIEERFASLWFSWNSFEIVSRGSSSDLMSVLMLNFALKSLSTLSIAG